MGLIKTGLYGGTFAPIHNGHIRVAIEALEQMNLDSIFFIPNYIPPHKKMSEMITDDRLRMLELALERFEKFEISEIEIVRQRISYTYDTVIELKNNFPDREFYFLIGEDSYMDFETWHKFRELKSEIKFVVYPRYKSYNELLEVFDDCDGTFFLLEAPVIDISSSSIRKKMVDGKSIASLVDSKVEEYIKSKKVLDE
ncbi:nicotinate (nicotinamide) nucleotide adenylyltransferase [bacterium]|nr:nicotinate (nicotinamide) nucleotide adenylyltransferase [bacterium]